MDRRPAELLAIHGDPDEKEGATVVHFDRGPSALYFLDGGGNVVELIDNPHLTNGSNAPFGPESLIEIAEIGLATADTQATRALIQEVLSAGVLWGGQDGSLLTAIGDDHGVVIVAPTGRGWIPVGLPAQPLPTTIVAAARTVASGGTRRRPIHDPRRGRALVNGRIAAVGRRLTMLVVYASAAHSRRGGVRDAANVAEPVTVSWV